MSTLAQNTVRRYRLLPESLPAAEVRVRNRQVIPYLLIVAGMFLISTFLGTRADGSLITIIPMAIVAALFLTYIFFVVPRRTRRTLARCWSSYALEIGPDYLLRKQSEMPDLRLSFSEIKRIERRPGEYIRVIGAQRKNVIGIPEGIEHFDEVWQSISTLAPVSDEARNRALGRNLISALFAGGFLWMLWSSSTQIVLTLATVLVGVMIWGIVEQRENPNVPRRGRRAIWLYIWIMFLIGLRVFSTISLSRAH